MQQPKINAKVDLITDIDILSIVEKGIRGGIKMPFKDMRKLITNTGKNMVKIKNRRILFIGT